METTTVTEIPVNRTAKKAIEESTGMEDRVSLALQQRGTREVYGSIDDLSAQASLRPSQYYQTLVRMRAKGKVEILKDKNPETGRERIVGVKLNYAPKPENIIENGAKKAKEESPTLRRKVIEPKITARLWHVNQYIQKKMAVQNSKKQLIEAGYPEAQINELYQTLEAGDPLAEEALEILQELVQTKQQLGSTLVDLEACRQTNNFNHGPRDEESKG